mgnify:CR=1 FL=1
MGSQFVQDGTPFDEAASSMQKCIRRGMEDDAAYWAWQLFQRYPHYVWRRLTVVAVEDIGLADICLVERLLASRASYYAGGEAKYGPTDPIAIERGVLLLLPVVREMAKSPKSREADHMAHEVLREIRIGKLAPSIRLDMNFVEGCSVLAERLDANDPKLAFLEAMQLNNGYALWLWQWLAEYAFMRVGVGHVIELMSLLRDVVEHFILKQKFYEPNILAFACQLLAWSDKDDSLAGLYASVTDGRRRTVYDWAADMHTRRGSAKKVNGMEEFIREGSKVNSEAYPSRFTFYDPVHGTAAVLADNVTVVGDSYAVSTAKQALDRREMRQSSLL